MVRWTSCRRPVLDFFLEEQESRNTNQQHSDGNRDEVIDSIAVSVSQVSRDTHPRYEPGALPTTSAKTTLRRTVPFRKCTALAPILVTKLKSASEPTARSGRHVQTEDQNREQQNAAPDSRHSDQGPNSKTHQALDQQIHGNIGFRPKLDRLAEAAPMKPSLSRCRMISCAASSAESSPVLMVTSASAGTSYGSEMPVNSFRIPARALAYKPLRSRCSQTSTEVAMCTRMNPP